MRVGLEASAGSCDAGGTSRYVRELISGLKCEERGIEAMLFDCRVPPGTGGLRGPLRTLWREIVWAQCVLPGEIERRRVTVLHLPGAIVVLRPRVPTVVTVHDNSIFSHPEWYTPWMAWYARHVRKRAIRSAAAVITPTAFGKREVCALLGVPDERVVVTHLGVSEEFLRPVGGKVLEETKARLKLERPFILYVGILSPRKNVERLIIAYHLLRRTGEIRHQLVLAGGNGWRSRGIFRTAKESDPSGDAVRFLGPVSSDLRALYRLADLVVYPSLYETFGLPPLEAMAVGTPVVASRAGSIPEVVGDAALLVEAEETTAIAEGMRDALGDSSLREELIGRGRQRVQQFRWSNTVDSTCQVYKQVGCE